MALVICAVTVTAMSALKANGETAAAADAALPRESMKRLLTVEADRDNAGPPPPRPGPLTV